MGIAWGPVPMAGAITVATSGKDSVAPTHLVRLRHRTGRVVGADTAGRLDLRQSDLTDGRFHCIDRYTPSYRHPNPDNPTENMGARRPIL
jgi:hypothetical protein